MWNHFKNEWRKTLYMQDEAVTEENMHAKLAGSLERIKHHGKACARIPAPLMKRYCDPNADYIRPVLRSKAKRRKVVTD
jgi:hypothetical protein